MTDPSEAQPETSIEQPRPRHVLTLAEVVATQNGCVDANHIRQYLSRKVDLDETDVSQFVADLWSEFELDPRSAVSDGAATAAAWMVSSTARQARKLGLALLQAMAGKGHAGAKFELALAHMEGHAVDRDARAANGMLEQVVRNTSSTHQLHRRALVQLADSLRTGRGCIRDVSRALDFYTQAAHLGDGYAANRVGTYYHGLTPDWSGSQDLERAASFYAIGVRHGDVKSQTALGVLHGSGKLRASDKEYGMKLLRRSVDAGDARATTILVGMRGTSSAQPKHASPPHSAPQRDRT